MVAFYIQNFDIFFWKMYLDQNIKIHGLQEAIGYRQYSDMVQSWLLSAV
jgi:hypothetical protein